MNTALGVGITMACLVALALLGGAAVGTAGVATGQPESGPDDGDHAAPPDVTQLAGAENFDRVEFRIVVHEDGSAVWTFRYARHLENASEEEQFETFAQEFRTDDKHRLYTDFGEQAMALVTAGEERTGRDMDATNLRRNATIEQELSNQYGVVTMTFEWENFARQDDERLVIGDTFEGGLHILEDQSIVVECGPGLEFERVDPAGTPSNDTIATSDTITWMGPEQFADNRPRVVFYPDSLESSPAGLPGSDESAPDTAPPQEQPATAPRIEDNDFLLLLVGVVVLLLGIGSAVAWRHDGTIVTRPNATAEPPGQSVDEAPSRDEDESGEPAVPEEELLTDEDRVKRLLKENGGRMKQVNIVEETGWSKSKVSMLLSDMAESGEISKLRVGRENIISLDGHEPEAAGSPFENED